MAAFLALGHVSSLEAALPLLILQHARKKIFVSNNADKKNIVSDKCHKLSFYFRLDFTITNLTTGTSITASNNNTNSGWLVGAGIEWAFAPIGRRRSSIIILGWMIGHLLFLLGSPHCSPATLSPRATATFRW